VFSCRVRVRTRKPWNTWVNWNDRLGGGPVLNVRSGTVEIVAPQGMLLESRQFEFPGHQATIRRQRIGWAGIPIGKRDSIRLTLDDGMEFALTPESTFAEAWEALLAAGAGPE
jgi:hypothetical protein